MTLEELTAIRKRVYNMNFDQFCKEILERDPNTQDVWMCEKWAAFNQFCRGFTALAKEYVLRIMNEESS